MDGTPRPNGPVAAPSPAKVETTDVWPLPAQVALAVVSGVVVILLGLHGYQSSRWATRPAELRPGAAAAYRIDLNRADRAELLQLPGVGEGLAARITQYRREYGPFQQVNDLARVPGVGPSTLDRLRPWVTIEPASASGTVRGAGPVAAARKGLARPRGGKKEASLTGRVDINRAGVEELQRLPGVGPKLAQRVAQERLRRPFTSVDDLRRVPGIGERKLESLRPYVTAAGAGDTQAQRPPEEGRR